MTQVQRWFYLMLALSIALPAIGAAWVGQWILAVLFILLAVIWFAAEKQQRPYDKLLLTSYFLLAAGAGLRGVGTGWLLLGATAVVATWDLHLFKRQLAAADLLHPETAVVQTHLRRLLLVVGISLVLGTAVLLIQLNPSFNILFVLTVLIIWSLSQLIVHVNKTDSR